MPQRRVVSLELSRIDYCNSLLAGLPLSLISNYQREKNCAARLVVRASSNVHTTPILAQLRWLPVHARISYKIACLCFSSINSSARAYFSDILHLYSPVRPLSSSVDNSLLKFPLYKHKTKVILPSLILALLSGTHCHDTLEMLQQSLLSSPL